MNFCVKTYLGRIKQYFLIKKKTKLVEPSLLIIALCGIKLVSHIHEKYIHIHIYKLRIRMYFKFRIPLLI